MKRFASPSAKYQDAVRWIASEDAPADDDPPDILRDYLTVCLVADLFHVDQDAVARDVYAVRRNEVE